jgi:PAS domain-containing protein
VTDPSPPTGPTVWTLYRDDAGLWNVFRGGIPGEWVEFREVVDRRVADELEAENEKLRARLDALDTPHVLVLGAGRWTLEHDLACRESGRMAECEVHERVADWIHREGEPTLPKGRYVVGDGTLPAALSRYTGKEGNE